MKPWWCLVALATSLSSTGAVLRFDDTPNSTSPDQQTLSQSFGYLLDRALADSNERSASPGLRLLAEGRLNQARTQLLSEVRNAPDQITGWMGLIVVDLLRDKPDLARQQLDRAMGHHPGHPTLLTYRALFLASDGRTDHAVRLLNDTLRRHPKSLMAALHLGNLQNQLGNHRESITAFEKAAALAPREAGLRRSLALAWLRAGHPANAIRVAEEGLDSVENPLPLQLLLGRLLVEQARPDEALVQLNHIPPEADERREAVNWTVRAHMLRGEMDVAAEVLEASLAREPRDIALRYLFATIRQLQGDAKAASTQLQEILKLNPDYGPALNDLAALWAESDDPKQRSRAHELVKRALALAPEDPVVLDTAGRVAHLDGRLDDAVRLLNAALSRVPGHPIVQRHLALALHDRNQGSDRQQAQQLLSKVLEQHPDWRKDPELKPLLP